MKNLTPYLIGGAVLAGLAYAMIGGDDPLAGDTAADAAITFPAALLVYDSDSDDGMAIREEFRALDSPGSKVDFHTMSLARTAEFFKQRGWPVEEMLEQLEGTGAIILWEDKTKFEIVPVDPDDAWKDSVKGFSMHPGSEVGIIGAEAAILGEALGEAFA